MKTKPIFLSVVFAIVLLLGNTAFVAMANGGAPIDPCTQISGPSIIQVDGGRYKWTYQFAGTITPTTLLYILAPVCTPGTMYTVDPGGYVYPAGTGDSTTGFGVGDFSNVVIKLAVSSPNFYFYTDKLVPTGSTSMQYKSGRNYLICPNIVGPGCPGIPQSLFPQNASECKGPYTFKGAGPEGEDITVSLFIVRNLVTKCIAELYQCTVAGCTDGCTEIHPWTDPIQIGNHIFAGCTNLEGNQSCQECAILGSSPSCFTYSSGGVKYKVPNGCQ